MFDLLLARLKDQIAPVVKSRLTLMMISHTWKKGTGICKSIECELE